jgi:hypothetical protein
LKIRLKTFLKRPAILFEKRGSFLELFVLIDRKFFDKALRMILKHKIILFSFLKFSMIKLKNESF